MRVNSHLHCTILNVDTEDLLSFNYISFIIHDTISIYPTFELIFRA